MEIEDEYLGIIRETLEDYRRWFHDNSVSDIAYREHIDKALGAIS